MESVLESVFLPCRNAKYGCTENVSFGKESTHKKDCTFAEYCSCPVEDCTYIGSYIDLYDHYKSAIHPTRNYTTYLPLPRSKFLCGVAFGIKMNIRNKILIQREFGKRLLFPVQCFREPYGVYVTVSCIAPSSPEVGKFSYDICYTVDGHTMTYGSPEVETIREVSFQTPQDNYMLFPHSLVRSEWLEMRLCIKMLNKEQAS